MQAHPANRTLARIPQAGAAACALAAVAAGILGFGSVNVSAQFQMPDPKQMSGIPRPVTDLPPGSISVRLIRGSLSNNIAGHPVELLVAGKTRTVKTDESGRAQFDAVPPGSTVKASADVDGEHLESQEFPAPAQGGIRLMLVATDKNAAPATSPDAPAVPGQVVITNQSRIVMEPGDEAINLFYLLDISNTARVPVNPPPFVFDLPADARGAGMMEGSSPSARVEGRRVTVDGPFPPGHTFVQVGTSLPQTTGTVQITQTFPANIESLAVVAQKIGDSKLSSPQLTNQREMPADRQTFIAATGPPVAAGQPITLTLSGLPHHSSAPRYVALGLALGIVLAGVLLGGGSRSTAGAAAAERKKLVSRRDRLLSDLARVETERRQAAGDEPRLAARREHLIAQLEQVYGALDDDEAGPDPGDRAGVAA